MVFETVVILVALSLPVWLVAEQISSWRKTPRKQVERGAGTDAPSWAEPAARTVLPTPQRKAA
jgi:hypothetical protein